MAVLLEVEPAQGVTDIVIDYQGNFAALGKKAMTAARRRTIVAELCDAFDVSQRRARRALALDRSGLRYVSRRRDEAVALARRIEELAGAHPRYGYRRIWALLRREGWSVNKKAVHGAWKRAGLKLAGPRAAPRPRRPHGQDINGCHLRPSRGKDDVWTWDFLFDRTSDGRSLKWLSLVDEFTRECLSLEARRGMTADEIQEILAGVVARRGAAPHRIRSDNGPEFAAEAIRSYLEASGSGTLSVAPASPWQNGFAESFHSRLRDEFLEQEEFESVPQARALAALWKEDDNTQRPHSSLGYLTPAEFSTTCERDLPIEEDPEASSSTGRMY
jgi:transposase InsO family protein